MSKIIELFDTFNIKVDINNKNKGVIISDSKHDVKSGYSLICEVNATHAGTLINNRIYPPDSMQKGIKTWVSPYKKPVLVNHDDTKDPLGRVMAAKYVKTERGVSSRDYKPILRESDGYGYQRLTLRITDSEAIQKVLDGRYETVSVRMSTDHCWCSICDVDWSDEGPCEHTPGSKYENKLAYLTTGELTYREVSFVNIPADEYAGVKEAIISENKDSIGVKVYASNYENKTLLDLGNGSNLYTMLDSEIEEGDDVVSYLLDKSNQSQNIDKEEDVKLSDVTKEQLMDLDNVKELLKEASDKAKQESSDECNKAKTECADEVKKLKDEIDALKKSKKKDDDDDDDDDEDDAKKKKAKDDDDDDDDEDDAKKMKKKDDDDDDDEDEKKKKEEEEEEEEEKEEEKEEGEDDSKKLPGKKGSPVPNELPENKGKGKKGGVKHGAGNLSPTGEDPGDAATRMKELEITNKKILDENVRINSQLHRMVAERLYDLKKILRKPDVVSITTPDARNQKIEEYAQRSISSLKDQIKDLQLEQENALTTGSDGLDVGNPAISQSDLTNEVLEDKKKTREGKQETLTRLFPKSK